MANRRKLRFGNLDDILSAQVSLLGSLNEHLNDLWEIYRGKTDSKEYKEECLKIQAKIEATRSDIITTEGQLHYIKYQG